MNRKNLEPPALLDATAITGHTLLGVMGKPPFKSGNCFSVLAGGSECEGDNEFKIVNFCHENLEHLLKCGLTWPIKIAVLAGRTAIFHDERIPDAFYSDHYCEVCCPESLLPFPQIAAHARQEKRQERVVRPAGEGGFGIVSIQFDKRPTLGLPEKR